MILTSGKVVGNIGKQWKEVRDNRVENKSKQDGVQEMTGKEIIPVEHGIGK